MIGDVERHTRHRRVTSLPSGPCSRITGHGFMPGAHHAGGPAQAQDAVQDAFLVALRRLGDLREPEGPLAGGCTRSSATNAACAADLP